MAEAGTTQYRQELTVHRALLDGMRDIVRAQVQFRCSAQTAADAVQCVHELLSNVLKHAGDPRCVLTLSFARDCLRATVSDTSGALPVLREPDWIAESGRGLLLVARLADNWGADPRPDGKDVWFELHADPREGAA